MTELKFQQQIIDDVKRSNRESYAIKVNHRFLAGIPDLLIKHPDYEPVFIETKVSKVGKDGTVKIGTTAIQRNTMKMMSSAGLTVAVWTLVKHDGYDFIMRSNWMAVNLNVSEENAVSRVGKSWPIEELLSNPSGVIY